MGTYVSTNDQWARPNRPWVSLSKAKPCQFRSVQFSYVNLYVPWQYRVQYITIHVVYKNIIQQCLAIAQNIYQILNMTPHIKTIGDGCNKSLFVTELLVASEIQQPNCYLETTKAKLSVKPCITTGSLMCLSENDRSIHKLAVLVLSMINHNIAPTILQSVIYPYSGQKFLSYPQGLNC